MSYVIHWGDFLGREWLEHGAASLAEQEVSSFARSRWPASLVVSNLTYAYGKLQRDSSERTLALTDRDGNRQRVMRLATRRTMPVA